MGNRKNWGGVLIGLVIGVLLSTCIYLFLKIQKPIREELPRYLGTVNADSAEAFSTNIGRHEDKIVGLKIFVEPSTEKSAADDPYHVYKDDDSLNVSYSTLMDGGSEVLMPTVGVNWQHGGYAIDGYFLVKSGGLHQGVVSFGLQPVSQSAIMLSSQYEIVDRDVAEPQSLKPR